MKKHTLFLLWIFTILVSAPMMLTSCGGGDDENGASGDNTEIGGGGGSSSGGGTVVTEEMSPLEQKQFMEKVALSFLDEYKAENIESVVYLTEYLTKKYSDYDTEAVEEWFEAYMDQISTFIGESTRQYSWGYEYYSNYAQLYTLSNLKGKFTAKDESWVYEKSDDLQFVVRDADGNSCVAKLTAKGNVKKVYVGDDMEWVDYYYDSDERLYHDYYDRYERTVAVPEYIELTFVQGAKTLVKAVVKTDLSSMSGEDFDLSKDSYTASANIFINDYEFVFDNISYKAGKNASVSYKVKRKNKNIISFNISADVDASNEKLSSCKNADVSIDIMGDIQIKGKCTDVVRFIEYMEEASENDENEGQFKSYVNLANSLLDLGVYYKGKPYKFANIKIEPAVDKYYYYEYWYCDFVMYFNDDNTTYTLLEVFFNDKDFASVISKFEGMMKSYSKLFD